VEGEKKKAKKSSPLSPTISNIDNNLSKQGHKLEPPLVPVYSIIPSFYFKLLCFLLLFVVVVGF